MHHPVTPDGRYFVVRGRLWRCTNPDLDPDERAMLVQGLMSARRKKRTAMRNGDVAAREAARAQIEEAKRSLGERGPVWWTDGAPDFTGCNVRNTPYAIWFAELDDQPHDPAAEWEAGLGQLPPTPGGSALDMHPRKAARGRRGLSLVPHAAVPLPGCDLVDRCLAEDGNDPAVAVARSLRGRPAWPERRSAVLLPVLAGAPPLAGSADVRLCARRAGARGVRPGLAWREW